MEEVAIVGTGMIKFGRYPEKLPEELGAEAVALALQDAGVQMKDIQALFCGNLASTSGAGQRALQQIGQTGIPVINVANACATGSTAVREAYFAVASGAYDIVLALGYEQMGKAGLLGTAGIDPAVSPEGRIGTGLMPGVFGMAGMEHMKQYGTDIKSFAKIAVKNHHHGTMNPLAQYQIETPLEDVINARMVAYPNTLYMCCPTGDGAAALVITSAKKARQLTTKPVTIAASVITSDPFTERDATLPDINTLTRNAAKEAYQKAGITAKDLNLVELHDCFATAELLHYENLGLCADGDAPKLIEDGETSLGGRIPVNVSGGLLSKGHPLGATGVANICEVTWHLRGDRKVTKNRQVEGAKVGLAHVIGLCSTCTIHIMKV